MHTLQRISFLAAVVALGVLVLSVPVIGHAQVGAYGGQYMQGYPYSTQGYSYPGYSNYQTYIDPYASYGNSGYNGTYGSSCGTLSYTVRMGSGISSDVMRIQDALRSQGYFNYTSTGVFGQLTRRAVMQFQTAHGMAASGVVDAATWRYLQGASCGTSYTQPYVGTPSYPTYPGNYYNQYPYHNQYPQYYNSTPAISSVDGPTQVSVGQAYTWTVNAKDNNYGGNYNNYNGYYGNNGYGQGLSTTVTWGDEGYWSNNSANQYPSTYAANTVSQTAFTHVYYQRGTYNATFKVTNTNGQVASYVTTVYVY